MIARRAGFAAALGVGALLLSACGAGSAGPGVASTPGPPDSVAEDVPSALDDPRDPSFPDPLIDLDDLLSGGPPPDGIPAIDDPRFQTAADVDWLAENEPILSLTAGGETRGYPIQVLTWHEIVNDTVGGVPVAVTYCPLCNSGVAFERVVAGRVLTFGTSGMLYADNLVMYDRQTESLWPQLTGEASVGFLTGEQLTAIPMGVVGWDDFRAANADALVLTRETGFDRPYGDNPYRGYDEEGTAPLFPLPDPTDDRLTAKTRVVGVDLGGERVALVREQLAEDAVTHLSVGDRELVVFHTPGQASALDTPRIADGEDIGTVGVFDAEFEGEVLEFSAEGEAFVDDGTGSRWDILGNAIDGPEEGATLTPVTHLDTFWFAWVAFHPDTELRR